mmetsp:Transcript_28023/g.50039  ORF Transcript_28023/g.50039 Transcript_28023/m.50039 type:complete len:207 (+) Transcript_28023:392-1012(+)
MARAKQLADRAVLLFVVFACDWGLVLYKVSRLKLLQLLLLPLQHLLLLQQQQQLLQPLLRLLPTPVQLLQWPLRQQTDLTSARQFAPESRPSVWRAVASCLLEAKTQHAAGLTDSLSDQLSWAHKESLEERSAQHLQARRNLAPVQHLGRGPGRPLVGSKETKRARRPCLGAAVPQGRPQLCLPPPGGHSRGSPRTLPRWLSTVDL